MLGQQQNAGRRPQKQRSATRAVGGSCPRPVAASHPSVLLRRPHRRRLSLRLLDLVDVRRHVLVRQGHQKEDRRCHVPQSLRQLRVLRSETAEPGWSPLKLASDRAVKSLMRLTSSSRSATTHNSQPAAARRSGVETGGLAERTEKSDEKKSSSPSLDAREWKR